MSTANFYDRLAPFYHLVYPDWEFSVRRQAVALDKLIKSQWGGEIKTVLDVACGVGTQALGLAQLGYEVTASDISSAELERARREASARGLSIAFSQADMREAFLHHGRQFDLVLACDNSVPHLLSDDDLLAAFRQFFQCTRPGGGCILSVRDYDKEEREGVHLKPLGVRAENGTRYCVFQVWEFRGPIYDLSMYFVEDRPGADCVTHVMRTQYYAVTSDRLISLLTDAGFRDVRRVDHPYPQPVLLGVR
jgi:SAM-dependent methyltransferase